MSRENAGYRITDTLKLGDYELVIGERPSAPAPFVCWYCKNGSDYFWGTYCANRNDAVRNLIERASHELGLLEQNNTAPNRKDAGAR